MTKEDIIILGIESSCDETSASVLHNGKILSNVIATQEIHQTYGGVIPELASRAHQQNIIPVVAEAIKKSGFKKEDISAVAFTNGPGLLGALLVGASFSKAFSMSLNIPLIEVNHMQAHILAHFIKEENNAMPKFPFLCLTVSGGHTQIVMVEDYLKMKVVGETLDDAAGEAFDKSAKILGLPYPGGPLVDKYAQLGNAKAFKFPHPQVEDLNFSFSGLKTSIMYFVNNNVKQNPKFIDENLNDICASVQQTIIDVLMSKLIEASQKYNIKEIAIAGGVSANSGLRNALLLNREKHKWNIFIPKFEYCTDNAAMIAITGYYKFLKKDFVSQSASPSAKMSL